MEQINRLNNYLKNKFGTKVYKISLNGGMTCPNRDGTIGTGGCIFCSSGGSGDFAESASDSIDVQIDNAVKRISQKVTSCKYIAYFQAYTNTYAPVSYLRKLFTQAINHPDIVALSIGTRPDCLPDDVLALLDELNHIKPVFIELGFQTSSEISAALIRRGYNNECFSEAVSQLHKRNLDVVVHVIIGLPNETEEDIIHTIKYINKLPVNGIKIQLMYILENTDLQQIFLSTPEIFHYTSLENYVLILGKCIEHLRPDIVIHRLTGDGPKSILIAPLWSGNKKKVLNTINSYIQTNNIVQGRKYTKNGT